MTGKLEQLDRAVALRKALADDALELTYEEACEEIKESGRDPAEIAKSMRASTMSLVTRVRKERLVQARERLRTTPTEQSMVKQRNAGAIRKAIARLASEVGSIASMRIAVAHRNGKDQTDGDVQTLWQDLVDLGAVKDDDLAG